MEKKELLKEYNSYNINLYNVDLIIDFFAPGKLSNSMIEYDDDYIEIEENNISQKADPQKKRGLFKRKRDGNNSVTVFGKVNNVISVNGDSVVSTGDNPLSLKLHLSAGLAYDFFVNNQAGTVLIKDNICKEVASKGLGSVEIKTSLGNITIDNCEFVDIMANAATANITLRNSSSKSDVTLNTATGNIVLDKIDTNSLNAKTSTGNIETSDSKVKTGKLQSSTGNLKISNSDFIDTFGFYSTTGNITLDNCHYNEEITLKKTFGTIREK